MSGGRPSKPLALVKGHRTKAEKAVREKAESALLTGSAFKESSEVKLDPVAHKEFTRLKKIFKSIGKDDSLHESAINRYCLLHSECKQIEVMIGKINKLYDTETYLTWDKQLMAKRKMMHDIEKENLMTIQSALRSIPKKPEEKGKSAMAEFLERRKTSGP